ncbi:hypothetical protein ACIRRA_37570 [Nocardia sp. NPDC101769]|uniref:hypothetical protein n=1 Tax=Nocardia sp. NPDC101769 TaxID=3364333 RepID=UPI003830D680
MSFRVVPDQLRFLSAQQANYQNALWQITAATKAPAAPVHVVGGDLVHQTICTMLKIQGDTIFGHTETAHTNWGQGSEAMIVASRSYEMTDSTGAAAVQAAGVNV